METVELSERMLHVASLVSKGSRICDIGCDHGYVSIHLVQTGVSPLAIAMDVRKGPLNQAKKNIELFGLTQKIETRLSDGFNALSAGEADCAVIAGMGGPLMQKILTEGMQVTRSLKELVLQPQSEIPEFRKFLCENDFRIIEEDMVCEDGKFYFLMKVEHGRAFLSKEEMQYGPCLLATKHPVLLDFLLKEEQSLSQIRNNLVENLAESTRSCVRLLEVEETLNLNRQVRMQYFNK